jgi:hypothetical protein
LPSRMTTSSETAPENREISVIDIDAGLGKDGTLRELHGREMRN